jgi:MoaA/NifB/PqqE/SkfB family radical SAM enzyme
MERNMNQMTEPTTQIKRLNLLVTKYCNLHCRMCDFTQHYPDDELSLELLRSIIKEFAALGGQQLEMSGGEPMVRKGIYDIVADSHSYGLKTLMMSNGVLIGDAEVQKLLEAGLSAITFSLEGPEPLNDKLRGPGNFQKTLGAIGSFLRRQAQYPDFQVYIGITLSRYNYQSIVSFSKYLLEEVGVHKISINPFEKWLLKGENREIRPVEFAITPEIIPSLTQELNRLMEYGKTVPDRLPPSSYLRKVPDFFMGKNFIPPGGCQIPSTFFGVDPVGWVYPCWKIRNPVGNLKEMTLADVLKAPSYRELCEQSLAGKCNGCLTSCYAEIVEPVNA